MGASARPALARAASALALVAIVVLPLQGSRTIESATPSELPTVAVAADYQARRAIPEPAPDVLRADLPLPRVFNDNETHVSFVPPAGWVRGPASALNPVSDPPEPVFEIVRYQVRLSDPSLYAAPIPITSGLVADAGAVITVGLARVDSGLVGMDARMRGDRELGAAPGFVTLDDEAVYEGVHVFSRYFFSRPGDRVVVIRAAANESDWSALADTIMTTVRSLRADPLGANAPAAPARPPPPAPVVEPAPDATAQIRQRILSRAASLLGLRYVWGGNSTQSGMDCSAYVSWTWSVGRYTTDSLWEVSFPIGKSELRPGDAMNLTIGRDPKRTGHIRIFEAWANAEHTLVWVYEETPPRVVHRVIVYDDRYQPIRLAGLSSAGEVRLIPGTPAPTPTPRPATTRRPVTATPRPTPRPSGSVSPRPSGSVSPRPSASASPRPSASGASGTATVSTPTPRP
ncbi:MAG: NlpC/P60 family protein [Chloroflexi bacterium]|nr:MAG: NlpC/P60 family protein [Chloroflexota bacterium]